MATDFTNTLNLPATEFSMRANLPAREPETLAYWQQIGLYRLMLENAAGKPTFELHDGPPFSNGNIHMGTALNKVLKDREITIIRECFGIGCHEKGLEEIGDQLGLTRERVRQIREKSIAKLRDSGNAKILMKYLG